ncbi:hypothetical protein JQ621_03125 [Bradyrhizobium manausense]|uniref:hypothetical protein n=1 Tax=Bradyrhizobium manausense TaxID=989370 RepID=UPI001BA79F42|nr:hypothetical protein [Bradyrhizobium manausense]MBR1086460.1 hypothetical protein [Bradyrhizobium manausense]
MALFTLTINNFGTALDRQVHEVERVQRYLLQAAQDVRSSGGRKTSGNILDAGAVVGSWTLTPQAST